MDAILRLKDVMDITGLSKSTIDAKTSKLSPYFDPAFPQKFKLGYDRAVGWSRKGVEEWVNQRAITAGQPPPPPSLDIRRPARPKKPTATAKPIKAKRKPARKTLAEAVVQGSDLVAHIAHFLSLPTWTPAMGCLIASGIAPEVDVQEIPRTLEGNDLCDNALEPLDSKVRLARQLLDQWNDWAEDEDPIPTHLKPSEFLYWCWDNEVDTPWLQLIRQVHGSNDASNDALVNAQLALLLKR